MAKKTLHLLFVFSICLLISGCRSTSSFNLLFHDIPWGSTQEETLSILDYSKDEIAQILTMNDDLIILYDQAVFGESAITQKLYFDSNHLYRIEIDYSDTSDMEKVYKELIKTYGQPAKQEDIFISTGGEYQPETLTTSENHKFWVSGKTFAIDDPKTEELKRTFWEEHLPYLQTDADWEHFVKSSYYTFLWMTTDGTLPRFTKKDNPPKNRIIFYAENYVIDHYITPWQEK